MASHWHLSNAMRPGNFGFPAVTLSRVGVPTSLSKAWLTRPTTFLAGPFAALLALQLVGVSIDGAALTMAACIAILLFGLPHGALDLEIIKRERGTGRLGTSGLILLYLGLAAAMAAVWRLAPVVALAIFIVVAVIHFAEDWEELQSQFLAQGMAIALLAAPALFHMADLERLFIALSGRSDAALVANLILLLAPVSMALASVAAWTLWQTGFRDQAVAGVLMLIGMTILPPVVGFALFFCLYHSPRHLGAALSRVDWSPSSRWIIPLVTLAALGIAAALFANAVRADLPAQLVAASFMTLSLLTVPHMVVPAVVDALALRRSEARNERGRLTA